MRSDLREDYLEFLAGFGLEPPDFPGSVSDLLQRANQRPPHRELKSADFLDELRDFCMAMHSDLQDEVNTCLNPTGYRHLLREIAGTSLVSADTLGSIFCGEFPTGMFNAQARRTGRGTLCLFNYGLRRLIFNSALAVAYPMRPTDDGEGWAKVLSDDASLFGEAMVFMLAALLNYIRGGDQLPPEFAGRRPHSLSLAGHISHSMRLFVVAHEVAHAELGHLDSGHQRMVPTAVGDVELVQKSRAQEFEADGLAQRIMLERSRQAGTGVAAGGIHFLTLAKIVALVRTKLGMEVETTEPSHPPLEERIGALHAILKHELGPDEYVDVCQLEALFIEVLRGFEQCEMVLDGPELTVWGADWIPQSPINPT